MAPSYTPRISEYAMLRDNVANLNIFYRPALLARTTRMRPKLAQIDESRGPARPRPAPPPCPRPRQRRSGAPSRSKGRPCWSAGRRRASLPPPRACPPRRGREAGEAIPMGRVATLPRDRRRETPSDLRRRSLHRRRGAPGGRWPYGRLTTQRANNPAGSVDFRQVVNHRDLS